MLSISNIRVRSFDIGCLDLYWDLDSQTYDPLDYTFTVQRSDAQFGPFRDVTGPFSDKYHFRDTTLIHPHNPHSTVYYRIKVIKLSDSSETFFPEHGAGVHQSAKADLVALEMARVERRVLEECEGRKVWVFPRKTFGVRCSCYDVVMGRRTRSQCQTCFDTGWVGGFHSPLEVFAQIRDPSDSRRSTEFAEITTGDNTTARFPNFPEIFPGWVIVEAENMRWKVGPNINKLRKSRALIRQDITLNEIEAGDIEFALPMNLSNLEDLVASPIRNYTNPQDLQSDHIFDSALSLFMPWG